jgi:hypothetical protein
VNYQILLDKEQSVLGENIMTSPEHGNETSRLIHAPTPTPTHSRIDFLLCSSCFWCASYFNYTEVVTRCPTCDSNNIESLPISNGEFYAFSYDRNRGVTLEFSKKKETA